MDARDKIARQDIVAVLGDGYDYVGFDEDGNSYLGSESAEDPDVMIERMADAILALVDTAFGETEEEER